jgi:hypothetical protein
VSEKERASERRRWSEVTGERGREGGREGGREEGGREGSPFRQTPPSHARAQDHEHAQVYARAQMSLREAKRHDNEREQRSNGEDKKKRRRRGVRGEGRRETEIPQGEEGLNARITAVCGVCVYVCV